MSCCCTGQTCPHCDPGIEAFYQQKVEQAKRASAAMKADGIDCPYENLLDAKDIWYEYCELRDQETAERYWDNEFEWMCIENEIGDPTEELKLMYAEYCDAYSANEWGDEMWERGIDPWDDEVQLLAEDMQRDADIEGIMMCRAAEAEEAYFKKEKEEAERAKRNRAKWGL